MKKIIISLLLVTAICSNVMAASESDLPIYYIGGRQVNTSGFFYNNYYATLGFAAGQWNGMKYQNATIQDSTGSNVFQYYSSDGLLFIPHAAESFGMQFNISNRIGYQIGLAADQGFFPSDNATIQTDSTNYAVPLKISSYSIFLDNTFYFAAYQSNSFKLAPYIIAGIGMSINNANLQTGTITKPSDNKPQDTPLDFKPTTNISPAGHIGTGLSFYFLPSDSFSFGQIISVGYDFQYHGEIAMNYDQSQAKGTLTKGNSLKYTLIENTISLKYGLTF